MELCREYLGVSFQRLPIFFTLIHATKWVICFKAACVLSASAPRPSACHYFSSPRGFPSSGRNVRLLPRTAVHLWFLSLDSLSVSTWQQYVSAVWHFRCHGLCYLDLFFPIPPPPASCSSTPCPPQPQFHTQTRGLRRGRIGEWGSSVRGKWAQTSNDLLFLFRPVPCGLCLMVNEHNSSENILLKDHVWQGISQCVSSREFQVNAHEFKILGYNWSQNHFTC